MSTSEFEGIFLAGNGTRAPMSKPPRMKATKRFIREVQDALGIPDERATEAADWVVNKMERYGAYFAEPVFDMDGNGPKCSFCGMIWPLCGHHHMSGALGDDKDDTESETTE